MEQPMPENLITAALRDWWQFILAIFGIWGSYRVGTERQRWRVDEIGKAVEGLNARVAALEGQGREEAVSLARMLNTQQHIVEALAGLREEMRELRHEMRNKADRG